MAHNGTALPTPLPEIRIFKVAGRFLVFDSDAVAALRHKHNTNGMLLGTLPQQPSQSIFLGLPLELRPEQADELARQGAACIIDDVAAHQTALASLSVDPTFKRAYVETLRRQKQAARQAYLERSLKRAAVVADRLGLNSPPMDSPGQATKSNTHPEAHLADTPTAVSSLTPTSSSDFFFYLGADPSLHVIKPRSTGGSLCGFLQRSGYYITPGLRFGAQYSVYPGDPLRFHAHFMANEYDWNTGLIILDILGAGRLATAVKKSFLFGSQPLLLEGEPVRTFSVEWAAM